MKRFVPRLAKPGRILGAVLLAATTWAVGLEGWLSSPIWFGGLVLAALAMLRLVLGPGSKPRGTPPWPYRPGAACRAAALERLQVCGIDLRGPVSLPAPVNDVGAPAPANDVGAPARLAA
jgi:hypothetical protein